MKDICICFYPACLILILYQKLTPTFSHSVEQIMAYYQRGIVNASFVAGVCLFADFVQLLTVLLIVMIALSLQVQIQHTQHSIIELCYLTCQIKSLFDVYLF
jgi:hypothetical protein